LRKRARGFASVETVVGVGLAFTVILASLMLVRGTCRLGSRISVGSDRALAALWALERIAEDLQRAGVGVGRDGVDERVELHGDGTLGIRADLDRDVLDEAREPEERIGSASAPVTTGNDEVLVFLRRSPDTDHGEPVSFEADMDGPDTETMPDGTPVARRDGVVETVRAGRAMGPDDERSAVLYRVSFVHDADRFGTSRFYSAQPLLERVTSFRVRAVGADGAEVGPCGGEDGPAGRDCRRSIRRVVLELRLEDVTDVFRREVFLGGAP
jgi:hypothetical protein